MKFFSFCLSGVLAFLPVCDFFQTSLNNIFLRVKEDDKKIISSADVINNIESIPDSTVIKIYETSAYCGCEKCCGKTNKITANGEVAVEGVTVATDKTIPFGTKIVIDGKTYTVQDRGGAITGNRIDIYFDSHEKALQYGRQTKEVTIFKGE